MYSNLLLKAGKNQIYLVLNFSVSMSRLKISSLAYMMIGDKYNLRSQRLRENHVLCSGQKTYLPNQFCVAFICFRKKYFLHFGLGFLAFLKLQIDQSYFCQNICDAQKTIITFALLRSSLRFKISSDLIFEKYSIIQNFTFDYKEQKIRKSLN